MQKADFLIVGGGIAGSILALELVRNQKTVVLICDSSLPSSSLAAGGLINPVTGKYLAKTWLVEELFSELNSYYSELESQLKASFYHPIGLFRPFTSEEHKKSSLSQIEKHELHEYIQVKEDFDSQCFNVSLGGMFSSQAGWVNVPEMLDKLHAHLKQHITWKDEAFEHDELTVSDESVTYNNIEAEKVVFCEGFYAKDNPLFSWLPFNSVKGETLLGTVQDYDVASVINQGKWVIPLGNGQLRLGATYSWHELDFNPSEKAKNDLLGVADKILLKRFEVTGQQAGVRPATKDRRPFLGKHPKHSSVYVFNGLGTKGVSLAPYFAKQLVRNILYDEVINREANIERFYTLYS